MTARRELADRIDRLEVDYVLQRIERLANVSRADRGLRLLPRADGPRNDTRLTPQKIGFRRSSVNDGVSIEAATSTIEAICRLWNAGGAGDDEPEDRVGKMCACRLLGLSWADTQKVYTDAYWYGYRRAAEAWHKHFAKPDPRFVGHVYLAEAENEPAVRKIGFSTNPEKRARSLTRQLQKPISIIATMPGSRMHEWAIHESLLNPRLPAEWHWADRIPDWLFRSANDHRERLDAA